VYEPFNFKTTQRALKAVGLIPRRLDLEFYAQTWLPLNNALMLFNGNQFRHMASSVQVKR